MKTSVITTITLTFVLLRVIMMAVPVSGHSGLSLSAWSWTPPTIDGTIDTAVEWANASTAPFTSTDGLEGIIYVMNDGSNLYMAVRTTDSTLSKDNATNDKVFIYFDNNHDGVGPDAGDDIIGWNGYLSEGFRDGYSDGNYVWRRDTDAGGDSDGSGEATGDGTYNYFEISHPLNTTDDAHDFSLSIGDTVGFALRFTVDGSDRGWCPSSDPAEWHGIGIASSLEHIYIRADGSVDPPTPQIFSADNVTYTFINNVYCPVIVERDNIVVDGAGFIVQGTGTGIGINLTGTSNVTITKMEIRAFEYGIRLDQSSNNKILGNNIRNNWCGIWAQSSFNNSIAEDRIENNTYGAWIFAPNNTLCGNTITNNSDSGLVIDLDSSGNTISRNYIANNTRGVWIIMASDNKFYHNNFINNTEHVHFPLSGYANSWDGSVEGNYWGDYACVDSNNDGIGDSAYVIDVDNIDNFPLMGVFSSFNTSLGYHMNVISNSTIQDFQYFESNSTIKMYVSGLEGVGFCRVCIPHTLISPDEISVIIDDGLTPVLYHNYALDDNGTHRWIYFTYEHSTHEVDIIPELPSFLIPPLFMIATLLAVIVYRRKTRACGHSSIG